MIKPKLKKAQSPTSNESTAKQSSPFSSKRKLIINSKDLTNNNSPKNSPKHNNSTTSPVSKDSKASPKSEKKHSILHNQRFDRAKTLKVVFRRPSEIVNPNSQNPPGNINNNLNDIAMQRGFSIDFDINDKNPLKLIPKSIILYEEGKKLIKKKSYKKAFIMILNSFSDRKDCETNFNVIDELKLNRVFFVCAKKIIKAYCSSKIKLPPTRTHNLLEILEGTLSNWFHYLTFLLIKYKLTQNKKPLLNKSDCESQTSISSVEKEPLNVGITKEISHPEFNKSGSGNSIFKLMKSPFDKYDSEKIRFKNRKKRSLRSIIKKKIPDYVKYISIMTEKDFSKFNELYELEELIYHILEMYIYMADINKKEKNFRNCFIFLDKGNEFTKCFEFAENPDILNLCAKLKLNLANLYFEFGYLDNALEIYDDLLSMIQNELTIRIHMKYYQNKRKNRLKLRKCIKVLACCLINISKVYMQLQKYDRIIEGLRLHELCSFFLIPVDEIKRYMTKSYNELHGKFEIFFEEISELNAIIIEFLKEDHKFLQYHELLINELERKQAEKNDPLSNYQKHMDEIFPFVKESDNRTIFRRTNEPIAQLNKKNSSEASDEHYNQMVTMNKELNQFELNSPSWCHKQKNFKEEDEIKGMLAQDSNASFLLESLLDYDSFAKSLSSTRITNFKSFVSLKKLKQKAKESTSKIKDLRLASKTYNTQYLADYKPKIMTTNKYFQPIQITSDRDKEEIDEYFKKRKSMDTLFKQYQSSDTKRYMATTNPEENLDLYLGNIVQKHLESKYTNENINDLQKKFFMCFKNEDFDKKEFLYCKKMLMMKRKENMKDINCEIPKKIAKIPVFTEVENEANFVEDKNELEQKVEELKEKFRKQQEENEAVELVVNEIVPKKKLYDVMCNIIVKYKDVFNFHKLARSIHIKKMKQLKEKEKLLEKNLHGGGSFKQTSVKFFSSNSKIKTKSDNVSFNSKNSFKFFSNSQKLKTKSDSKLENSFLSGRRNTQIDSNTRGSLLADWKQMVETDKKKEEKNKNIQLFTKSKKKNEIVPPSIVNGRMMDFLNTELNGLNDIEKKITKTNNKKSKEFKFSNTYNNLAKSLKKTECSIMKTSLI